MIFPAFLLPFVPPEEVRDLHPNEMAGLRVWTDATLGVAKSSVLGNVRERWMVQLKNETPFELGSVTVREVFQDRQGQKLYESPGVRIVRFGNLSAPYTGSLLAFNKSRENPTIAFEVPERYSRLYTSRRLEIVGATTFRHADLHQPGHLYAKMQFTKPPDLIALFKKDPSLLKVRSADGLTVTLMTFGTTGTSVARYVLAHGGSPKDRTKGGATIMHMAAIGGLPDVLDLARKLGGDPNVRNKDGITPLMKAIVTGQQAGWEWLLAHGARPNEGGVPAWTPARIAIHEGQAQALADLVKAGVNPRALDKNEMGWLHYGVENYMLLDAIARYGLPIEQRGPKTGMTPLMVAAHDSDAEATVWLLQRGADPNLKDRHGKNAFDYAKQGGNLSFSYYVSHYGTKR